MMKDLVEKYVGKIGHVFVGGMRVGVVIKDVKVSYGKNRYLVSPIRGTGDVWVEDVSLS